MLKFDESNQTFVRMDAQEEAGELTRMYRELGQMMDDRHRLFEQFMRYAKAERCPESDEEKRMERFLYD